MTHEPIDPCVPRLLKIPALNVVHVCGVVTGTPRGQTDITEAVFDLAVRSYRPGKKSLTGLVTVHCHGPLADAVRAHINGGDVVLITGSLHRSQHDAALRITASIVQFLSNHDE